MAVECIRIKHLAQYLSAHRGTIRRLQSQLGLAEIDEIPVHDVMKLIATYRFWRSKMKKRRKLLHRKYGVIHQLDFTIPEWK